MGANEVCHPDADCIVTVVTAGWLDVLLHCDSLIDNPLADTSGRSLDLLGLLTRVTFEFSTRRQEGKRS